MKNIRFDDGRIPRKAAGPRISGVPVVEGGIAGFPYTDAATGEVYSLDISGVKEVALLAGAAQGDTVHIDTNTFALSRTAHGAASPGGSVPLARVIGLPGDDPGPPANRMWVLQLPPTA